MKRLICFLVFYTVCFTGLCQKVVIKSEHDQILICGMWNTISVAAFGTKESDIIIRTNNGKVFSDGGLWRVTPDSVGRVEIEAWKMTPKGEVKIGSDNFRVVRYPDPILTLNRKSGGKLYYALARVLIAPSAEWINYYGHCATGHIIGFTLLIIRENKLFYIGSVQNPNGARFSDNAELENGMKSLMAGDKLIFTSITAIGPDRRERNLQPAEFQITGKMEKE